MNQVDWRLEGDWIKNCNCAFGCPCDFNARPTNGTCRAVMGMRIRKGHFGDVNLDGLSFFVVASWPGALHEGNGEAQPIMDERATSAQRDALFNIMSGKYSGEGTLFHIFSLIVNKFHDPILAPIRFEFDLAKRRAKVSIPGALETESEPICNPATGAAHRVQIVMPEGFEYRDCEVCSARITSSGAIRFSVPQGHGSLAVVVQTPRGIAA